LQTCTESFVSHAPQDFICFIWMMVSNLYGMHPVVYQYHTLNFISVKHNNIPMNWYQFNNIRLLCSAWRWLNEPKHVAKLYKILPINSIMHVVWKRIHWYMVVFDGTKVQCMMVSKLSKNETLRQILMCTSVGTFTWPDFLLAEGDYSLSLVIGHNALDLCSYSASATWCTSEHPKWWTGFEL
jgi:hypothetical protein